MSNNDFWDTLTKGAFVGSSALDFAGNYLTASEKEEAEQTARVLSAVEQRMSGRALNEGSFNSVRSLTDSEKAKTALSLPVEAGTRVQFANTADAVLAYEDPPAPGAMGKVISVKSASGQITEHEGKVFVRWADGKLRPTFAEHLRLAAGTMRHPTAATNQIRVASLGDLTDFLKCGADTLVHKATKDLWKVRQDGSEFIIERLFNDEGQPLKV